MQHYFTTRPKLAIACLTLLLNGCASDPVPVTAPILSGEKMLSESQDIANLGDRWKKGKQGLKQGEIVRIQGSEGGKGRQPVQSEMGQPWSLLLKGQAPRLMWR